MAFKKLTFIHTLSLRWKLFLTLVLFSVLPICGTLFLVEQLEADIKQYLYKNTRNDLTMQASRSIENIAVNFAENLESSERMRSAIVKIVGLAAGHFLEMPPLENEPLLYMDKIKPNLPYPEDLIVDPLHAPTHEYMVKYGNDISKYISYGNIAFHHPENLTEVAKARRQAGQLIRLLPLFEELKKSYGPLLYNLYIGMNTGLFAYYPAHAGVPKEYDPRKRIWYRLAVDKKTLVWRAPLRSVSTGRLLFTVSAPLYDQHKKIVGVIGLDILMEQGLSTKDITATWSNNTQLILADEKDDKATGRPGLHIVAHTFKRGVKDTEYRWVMGGASEQWVKFPDEEVKAKFMNAIASGSSGSQSLPWNGVQSLVAWAPFKKNSYFIAVVPEEDVMQLANKVLAYLYWASAAQTRIVEIAVVVIIFLSFLFAMMSSRAISKPMKMMIDAFRKLGKGDFSVRVDFKTGDERDVLIDTFNSLGPQLEHLVETQQALGVAQEIQENLLPTTDPKLKGWQVSGAIEYCDQTGGDYYDYYLTTCEEAPVLSVVVGDVSGHGIASALLMTTARALLRVHTERARLSAATRLTQVNSLLSKDVHGTGQFMTLFYLELIAMGDTVRWARAGHDPAVVYLPEQDEFTELKGNGLPLGVLEHFIYEENEVELTQDGTILLIGTDGIWEARKGGDGELYGKERLRDIIRENASEDASVIKEKILKAVDAWQKGVANADDVTLVVIKKDRTANQDCEETMVCNLDFLMMHRDKK